MTAVQHLNCKIFAKEGSTVHWPDLIPVFHRWIQTRALPEMLIDVADYAHVPAGPGVMLIAHEAFYSVDNRANRLGLLYNRRAVLDGDLNEQLEHVWMSASTAARMLEEEPGIGTTLRFDERECEVFVNDRLLAPNTQETFDGLGHAIGEFFTHRFGEPVVLDWSPSPRELFRVRVSAHRGA